MIKLHSEIDASVNTIDQDFESRFVIRDQTAIIYLSSFKGCDRACRMCHLTQHGQTNMTPATLEDFEKQAILSLEDAKAYFDKNESQPVRLHYNFMARGEPFLNETVMKNWERLSTRLKNLALDMFGESLPVVFKISTVGTGIYERAEDGTILSALMDLPFKENQPDIYYSLYSVEPEFRRRWLPKTENPTEVLSLLSRYGRANAELAATGLGGRAIIHGAFILGHNDDMNDIAHMCNTIRQFSTFKRFNLVRFNSPDITKWREPDEDYLRAIAEYIESRGLEVEMVTRVGQDVYGSCGQFYQGDAPK